MGDRNRDQSPDSPPSSGRGDVEQIDQSGTRDVEHIEGDDPPPEDDGALTPGDMGGVTEDEAGHS